MDFERCVKLCNFSHFISLCYSQSVSSKLLNSKEKGKNPRALGGTEGDYFCILLTALAGGESKE